MDTPRLSSDEIVLEIEREYHQRILHPSPLLCISWLLEQQIVRVRTMGEVISGAYGEVSSQTRFEQRFRRHNRDWAWRIHFVLGRW
jgi:hypothetical protein